MPRAAEPSHRRPRSRPRGAPPRGAGRRFAARCRRAPACKASGRAGPARLRRSQPAEGHAHDRASPRSLALSEAAGRRDATRPRAPIRSGTRRGCGRPRRDHGGAVVCGVDVHAEQTRPVRGAPDVDDCSCDRGVGVGWYQLGRALADLLHQLRVDGLVVGRRLSAGCALCAKWFVPLVTAPGTRRDVSMPNRASSAA